jgi:hypothetical protein
MSSAPPAKVVKELAALRASLNEIPIKSAGNVLIATWNLRAFGGLSETWDAEPATSPKRGWRAVALITEIVARFDVVALQEVKRETTALRFLLELLGPIQAVGKG